MIRYIIIGLLISFHVSSSIPVSKTTSSHGAHPTIPTLLGDIQGTVLNSRQGKHIYAFRGIRYAKAPVEELRFQEPVVAEKWEGIYNATTDGPACPQPFVAPTAEDCLMLNVYTNKLPKHVDTKRPVLVFFHGGDFSRHSGQSAVLGPHYLLDQDIILVTANYRLGILGWLNTGDKEATGNFGLKDQLAVLNWVKANIEPFGGNPNLVTIAGSTSGGISVSLHLVSTSSKGLFHKAIIMSGTGFGNIPIPNNNLEVAKRLAKHLKCNDDTISTMIKCLRSKSAVALTDPVKELKEFGSDPYYTWTPTLEKDHGQHRFLTTHPIELLTSGNLAKVPILIGCTADEFGYKAFELVSNITQLEELDKHFDKFAPVSFIYERNSDVSKVVSKELRKFYFADNKIDNTSLPKLAELYTDSLVGFSVNRAVELITEKSTESVYYYHFNYKGKYSNFYLPGGDHVPFGVVNMDDLIYLFRSTNFSEFKENDAETNTIQKLITIWHNFIDSGKPIPTTTELLDNAKWEPYNTKSKHYMEIGNKFVIRENLNDKRFAEWEKILPTSRYTKVHSGK